MSSTPLPKRRRLGTTSSSFTSKAPSTNALSQPFKSPFKSPLIKSAPALTPDPTTTTTTTTTTSTSTSTPTSTTNPPPPSSLSALQSQHTALLAAVSASRARLETCIQAQKLEGAGSDEELERLVKVWKGASRRAAEEVFEGWRDKIVGMGGWRAWRERERERERERGWGWDEGGRGEGNGEDGEGEGEEEGEEEKEEEEITMPMMLRSLGIELDVIGYDKEGQRWID